MSELVDEIRIAIIILFILIQMLQAEWISPNQFCMAYAHLVMLHVPSSNNLETMIQRISNRYKSVLRHPFLLARLYRLSCGKSLQLLLGQWKSFSNAIQRNEKCPYWPMQQWNSSLLQANCRILFSKKTTLQIKSFEYLSKSPDNRFFASIITFWIDLSTILEAWGKQRLKSNSVSPRPFCWKLKSTFRSYYTKQNILFAKKIFNKQTLNVSVWIFPIFQKFFNLLVSHHFCIIQTTFSFRIFLIDVCFVI